LIRKRILQKPLFHLDALRIVVALRPLCAATTGLMRRSQSRGFRDCYRSAAQLASKMNAFVFQVTCVCAVRRFLLLADFVAKGIAAKPRGRAAELERPAGDACAIPKTVEQSRTLMVDDPTSAALHRHRVRSPSSRKHHRTAGCRSQKGDRFARRGARPKG
jgi:hypothetical protein